MKEMAHRLFSGVLAALMFVSSLSAGTGIPAVRAEEAQGADDIIFDTAEELAAEENAEAIVTESAVYTFEGALEETGEVVDNADINEESVDDSKLNSDEDPPVETDAGVENASLDAEEVSPEEAAAWVAENETQAAILMEEAELPEEPSDAEVSLEEVFGNASWEAESETETDEADVPEAEADTEEDAKVASEGETQAEEETNANAEADSSEDDLAELSEALEALSEEAEEEIDWEALAEVEEAEEAEEAVPLFSEIASDSLLTLEQLSRIDFSSKRLLVAAPESAIIDPENLLSYYDGVALLQYPDAGTARNAYSYYYGKAEFVDVDTVFTVASGDAGAVSTGQMEEGSTPLDELSEAVAKNTNALSGTVIALIDTGAGNNPAVIEAVSMIGDDTSDANGHGTRMAQAIASNNADAKIVSIKAFGANGTADLTAVYAAIEYAIERKVDVINLSFSAVAGANNAAIKNAVSDALSAGIRVVAAAGNQGRNAKFYVPANIPGVFTIGSCDADGVKNASSNYGDVVDYNVKAESTSEAAAIFSALLAKNDLNVNGGIVFATDYEKPQEEEKEPEENEDDLFEVAFNAGTNWDTEYTIDQYLGITRTELVDYLNDNYSAIINTPYCAIRPWYGNNGENSMQRGVSYNCTGFVADSIRRASSDYNFTVSQMSGMLRYYPGRNGGYANASVWNHAFSSLNVKRVTYVGYGGNWQQAMQNAIDQMLADGKATKGDIVYFEPNWGVAGADCHIGIFWGDSPNENKWWHSHSPMNVIGNLEGKTGAFALTLVSMGENPPQDADPTIKVVKTSSMPEVTSGNDHYSFDGLQFGVYLSEADARADMNRWQVDTPSGLLTITDSATETASVPMLNDTMTIYVREIGYGENYHWPVGYDENNPPIKALTVHKRSWYETNDPDSLGYFDALGGVHEVEFTNVPNTAEFDLEITKVSKTDNTPLAGAVYQVLWLSDYVESANPATGAAWTLEELHQIYEASQSREGGGPWRVWFMQTGTDGKATLSENVLHTDQFPSQDFLYDEYGKMCIPDGTLIVTEVVVPTGYKLDGATFTVNGRNNDPLITSQGKEHMIFRVRHDQAEALDNGIVDVFHPDQARNYHSGETIKATNADEPDTPPDTPAYVSLIKTSTDPDLSNYLDCYDMTGIKYQVYEDAECTKPIAGAVIEITSYDKATSTGKSNKVELTLEGGKTEKDFWVLEVADSVKGTGFTQDKVPHKITVTASNTADNPAVVRVKDEPGTDTIGVVLTKQAVDGNGNHKEDTKVF